MIYIPLVVPTANYPTLIKLTYMLIIFNGIISFIYFKSNIIIDSYDDDLY